MPDLLISRFWDNYATKLKDNGIKPTAFRWYVRYVEKYIQKHPDKKLKYHTADDVSLYITSMQRVGYLKDWQFRQLVHALEILFTDIVKLQWAHTFKWDDYTLSSSSNSRPSHTPDTEKIDLDAITEGLLSKSYCNGSFNAVFKRYPQLIYSLIKEIRLRHYSIRTEQ
ncbi:MAG: phage integrase N-terminal SAM-like domain-containing protein, partial [Candidatus Scalindua sp.]